MKLILAIVDREDAGMVTQQLSRGGFSSTKLATSGGFLLSGNTTLMIGVEERMVQTVLDIIKKYSHSRLQIAPAEIVGADYLDVSTPVEIFVGGATVFVLDVERFEKV